MPILNDAQIFKKPKSILKALSKPEPAGYFCKGKMCYGNRQEEELSDYVDRENAKGFDVFYKNKDGSKGRLE